MLRADRHIVPFTGRRDEYAELREWCRDDKPPVRLLVGAGGVGKTRLALHLGEYLKTCGWSVTVVGAGQEADALSTVREAPPRSSIFLVVDYAETRTGLVELLRSVASNPARVRVLLIARSVGDWWWRLGADVAAVRDLVQAYPPLTLSARVDSEANPADLAQEALPHFARALGVPTPKTKITVSQELPLLALHAAALLAVLRSHDDQPVGRLVADLGVLKELLGHERRFWRHSADQAGLSDLSPGMLEQAVAVACLFGARNASDGANVLRRVPGLRDEEFLRRRMAEWLAQLYPSGSGYWGPLQPELVAEAHVIEQLINCPELVNDLTEVRAEQAYQMLTVLSAGATYQSAGLDQLERVLRADIERTSLVEIEAAIPYPTTALAETAVVVTRRILDALPAGADLAEAARWQARLGVALAQAGRRDDARTTSTKLSGTTAPWSRTARGVPAGSGSIPA
ncbi:MAG: hypothetical protein M3460_21125 [Actinomycetota bacterium]|nr:hypothetical protein [Actinomycetota bacterium]